jgi:hypothetical protein
VAHQCWKLSTYISILVHDDHVVRILRTCCRSSHVTEKSEAVACARRCRSSQLTGWWTPKEESEKYRAEVEERHKGSPTPTPNLLSKPCLRLRLVIGHFLRFWVNFPVIRFSGCHIEILAHTRMSMFALVRQTFLAKKTL